MKNVWETLNIVIPTTVKHLEVVVDLFCFLTPLLKNERLKSTFHISWRVIHFF